MPLAESIQPDDRTLALFIGSSGDGKSAAAYSFPKPMKVFDLDGRIRGGLVPWIDKKGIDYTYFPPKPQKGTTFEALNSQFAAIEVLIRTNQAHYETLVFDSLTWAANDFLLDAMPITHAAAGNDERGKKIGTMNIGGPSDYQFQSTGIIQIIAYLKTLAIPNIIVTGHTVNKWGKRKDASGKIIDPYGPSEITGKQLNLTDKLSESVPTPFDNVFEFDKVDTGSSMKFVVSGEGQLARNTFGIPYGNHDITKTNFYEWLKRKGWEKK